MCCTQNCLSSRRYHFSQPFASISMTENLVDDRSDHAYPGTCKTMISL